MKVWLIDLESVETRYTCQWKTHVPELLQSHGFEVEVIEGAEDIAPGDAGAEIGQEATPPDTVTGGGATAPGAPAATTNQTI